MASARSSAISCFKTSQQELLNNLLEHRVSGPEVFSRLNTIFQATTPREDESNIICLFLSANPLVEFRDGKPSPFSLLLMNTSCWSAAVQRSNEPAIDVLYRNIACNFAIFCSNLFEANMSELGTDSMSFFKMNSCFVHVLSDYESSYESFQNIMSLIATSSKLYCPEHHDKQVFERFNVFLSTLTQNQYSAENLAYFQRTNTPAYGLIENCSRAQASDDSNQRPSPNKNDSLKSPNNTATEEDTIMNSNHQSVRDGNIEKISIASASTSASSWPQWGKELSLKFQRHQEVYASNNKLNVENLKDSDYNNISTLSVRSKSSKKSSSGKLQSKQSLNLMINMAGINRLRNTETLPCTQVLETRLRSNVTSAGLILPNNSMQEVGCMSVAIETMLENYISRAVHVATERRKKLYDIGVASASGVDVSGRPEVLKSTALVTAGPENSIGGRNRECGLSTPRCLPSIAPRKVCPRVKQDSPFKKRRQTESLSRIIEHAQHSIRRKRSEQTDSETSSLAPVTRSIPAFPDVLQAFRECCYTEHDSDLRTEFQKLTVEDFLEASSPDFQAVSNILKEKWNMYLARSR